MLLVCAAGGYTQQAVDHSALLNGREYMRYALTIQRGHPFFFADSLMPGSVMYDGVHFTDVRLMFDESTDQLVTNNISNVYLVELVKQKVDSFTINGNRFIQLTPDTSFQHAPEDGFYQVLSDDKFLVLKKEKKVVHVNNGMSADFERTFETKLNYYLRMGNVYRDFASAKQFVSLFKNNSRELRRYIKKNGLSYKQDPDDFVIRLSAYAQTLMPSP